MWVKVWKKKNASADFLRSTLYLVLGTVHALDATYRQYVTQYIYCVVSCSRRDFLQSRSEVNRQPENNVRSDEDMLVHST